MSDEPVTPAVKAAAFRLLTSMMARYETSEALEAPAWIIVCTEAEFHSVSHHGPFDNPLAACEAAIQFQTDLNKGAPPDEIPYVVTVYPLLTYGDH